MPRDATDTREQLLRVAERLFASRGIAHVQLQEITRAAGQKNASAVHYHFGSRTGLVAAILDKHQSVVNATREAFLSDLDARGGPPEVGTLVLALVEPPSRKLLTEEGRDYLRLIPQLTERLGIAGMLNPPSRHVDSMRRAVAMLDPLLTHLDPDSRRERISLLVHFIAIALAQYAKDIERDPSLEYLVDGYTAELVEMLTGALLAPSPVLRSVPRADA